jgi:hypothetical protein
VSIIQLLHCVPEPGDDLLTAVVAIIVATVCLEVRNINTLLATHQELELARAEPKSMKAHHDKIGSPCQGQKLQEQIWIATAKATCRKPHAYKCEIDWEVVNINTH